MKPETRRLFIEMDEDTYWKLKDLAVKKKTTVKYVVEELIQKEVE